MAVEVKMRNTERSKIISALTSGTTPSLNYKSRQEIIPTITTTVTSESPILHNKLKANDSNAGMIKIP